MNINKLKTLLAGETIYGIRCKDIQAIVRDDTTCCDELSIYIINSCIHTQRQYQTNVFMSANEY